MDEAQCEEKSKLSTNYSVICPLLGWRRRRRGEEEKKKRREDREKKRGKTQESKRERRGRNYEQENKDKSVCRVCFH